MTQAVVQVRNIVARSGFANPLTLEVLVTDEDYLKVYADTTLLDNGPDYEITGIGDPNGVSIEIIGAEDVDNYVGTISFVAVYEPPLDQQTDLSAGGVLGRNYESGLDQQNRRLQSIGDRVLRSIKMPVTVDGDIVLDEPVDQWGLVWDDDTQRLIWAVVNDAGAQVAVLPSGGANGQFLSKASDDDFDAEWVSDPSDDKLPLAGGTMTGPIGFTYQTTPANPPAGVMKLYAKADGKLYTLLPDGTEAEVGSGATLNLYDYGAVGDGATDDTAAIAAWMADVTDGNYAFPPGRFRTSDDYFFDLDTTPALRITGAGESLTELIYTGTGDFITVERTTGAAALFGVIVDGITFTTSNAGTADALVLELDDAAPSSGSYETLARRVSNCRFMPEGAGDYWGECVRWNNTTYGTTENITVRSDATTSGKCVVYGGTRSAVDNTIHNLKGVSVNTLVLVENDTQEGLYISQLVGVSILRGVDWQVTGTPAPALVVDGGHLNVKAGGYAFIIDNVNAPFFSNLTVYLDGASPTAFSLDNDIAYAMNPSFSNVSVFGLGGSSSTTGLIIGAGVNRAVIGGISFNDLTTGMVLTGGMKDVLVTPAVGFYNCTNNVTESGNIWVPTDRNRVWKGTDSEQRFSLANNTGLNFTLENLSVSGAAKWVSMVLQGRNSLGSLRGVGWARWTSQDVNWVNSDFTLGVRRGDAEVTALTVRADGLQSINGALSRGAPVTKTGDFTLAATENWVLNNKGSACVVTLPAASAWVGREVMFTNIGGAFALTSASSNVVPKAGGAAGTAILAATDGVWATLVSDGTNWIITQAGT
jgi:hypothetical protein